MDWIPPGKNCGSCGMSSCDAFIAAMNAGCKTADECPYYSTPLKKQDVIFSNSSPVCDLETVYSGVDITGVAYDFIITALPGESSARKIILPFRSDLVEVLGIVAGDIVTGRPTGAGCPVQHVIKVLEVDPGSGLITGHVVGPAFARGNDNIVDLKHYHMIGFEGIANVIRKIPKFGLRMPFFPGTCMMHRTHTGIVNMIMRKSYGLHVRVEGIVIL
ncbi:MAG TPA: Fe-S cluster protein [Methanocorpusculum sp.]|nr:Fe-S cluster protein [Methanocorpusculum sp.]